MTGPLPLPTLLAALATEAQDLADDLRRLESALVPALAPLPGMIATLQPLDPLLQRLSALARVTAVAATEVPASPMPATDACIAAERLQLFLRDLRAPRPAPAPPTLFPPTASATRRG